MIDPASVVALGVLVSLVLATVPALATMQAPRSWWLVAFVTVLVGSAALLVGWVVANRLAGISTGEFQPRVLLGAAVGCTALSLALVRWGRGLLAVLCRSWTWYDVRADAVSASVVTVVGAAFRASIMFRAPAFVIGDSGSYAEAATTIREQFSFAPLSSIFPPGHPTFMAGVQLLLGPDFLAVIAVQHLLGIGTALCTYWLGRAFLPPVLALLPALGVAANGYLLIVEHGIYTEALFIPLVVLFALLAVRLLHGGGWRMAAAAGATLALAALTRLVIQPAVLAILLLLLRDGRRWRTWLRALVFVGAFAVVVSPWLAHNWLHYRYIGLSNSLGMQFLVRLWEEEGSYTWADPGETDPVLRHTLQALQEEKDRGVSYWQAWLRIEREFPDRNTSALLTAASFHVIRRQPGLYLDRTWFRLRRMWQGGFGKERVHDLYGQQERLGIRSPIFKVRDEFAAVAEQEGNKVDTLTRLFRPDALPPWLTLALTVAGAVGVVVSRRLRPALVPLGLGVGLLVITVMLNSDRARMHHPAEPFLLLTYAAGLWAIVRGLARAGARLTEGPLPRGLLTQPWMERVSRRRQGEVVTARG